MTNLSIFTYDYWSRHKFFRYRKNQAFIFCTILRELRKRINLRKNFWNITIFTTQMSKSSNLRLIQISQINWSLMMTNKLASTKTDCCLHLIRLEVMKWCRLLSDNHRSSHKLLCPHFKSNLLLFY